MAWRVGCKDSPSTALEHIVVDTRTPWEAVESVRSHKAPDGGHVIFAKAGE